MQGKFTGVCGSRKNLELALLKTGETPEEIEASFQAICRQRRPADAGVAAPMLSRWHLTGVQWPLVNKGPS